MATKRKVVPREAQQLFNSTRPRLPSKVGGVSTTRSRNFGPKPGASRKFPTGASRFPSTAKTKAEFTKMLGTATPAKRRTLQNQFKSINGTPWRGTATKFPSRSDFNKKAAGLVKGSTPRKKTPNSELQRLAKSSGLKSTPTKRGTPVRRGRNLTPGTPRRRPSTSGAYYTGGPNSPAYFTTTGARSKSTAAARKRLNAAKKKRRSTAKKR